MSKEGYIFLRILERKNKEGKSYKLALVLFNRKDDSDLLRILVTDEVAKVLVENSKNNADITSLVSIEYNSYQKVYQPKIKI